MEKIYHYLIDQREEHEQVPETIAENIIPGHLGND